MKELNVLLVAGKETITSVKNIFQTVFSFGRYYDEDVHLKIVDCIDLYTFAETKKCFIANIVIMSIPMSIGADDLEKEIAKAKTISNIIIIMGDYIDRSNEFQKLGIKCLFCNIGFDEKELWNKVKEAIKELLEN